MMQDQAQLFIPMRKLGLKTFERLKYYVSFLFRETSLLWLKYC